MQASLIPLALTGLLAGLLAAAPAAATTAYISNEKGNSVTVVDLDKLAVVKTVEVGQRPRGIALSKDEKLVYVCLGDDDTIAILDSTTLGRVGELPSGPDPEQMRVSPDGKLVFVANYGCCRHTPSPSSKSEPSPEDSEDKIVVKTFDYIAETEA